MIFKQTKEHSHEFVYQTWHLHVKKYQFWNIFNRLALGVRTAACGPLLAHGYIVNDVPANVLNDGFGTSLDGICYCFYFNVLN